MIDRAPHVGEFVELYALGMLEPLERARVDAHAANCVACTRALGVAEAAVAALDERLVAPHEPPERLGARIAASARATAAPSLPGRPAPRRLRGGLATAAALILAAGLAGGAAFERSRAAAQDARESAILATLAGSHFEHVSFVAHDAAAPVAKAIYARDGSWLYVIVNSAACGCRVVARSAAGERDLGAPQARGSTATLFVRDVPRPASLALDAASGREIAAAALAYPKP